MFYHNVVIVSIHCIFCHHNLFCHFVAILLLHYIQQMPMIVNMMDSICNHHYYCLLIHRPSSCIDAEDQIQLYLQMISIHRMKENKRKGSYTSSVLFAFKIINLTFDLRALLIELCFSGRQFDSGDSYLGYETRLLHRINLVLF